MAETIYVAKNDQGARLVRASMRQQVLSHVAGTEYTVTVATQDDLVEQLTAGTKVEQYQDPPGHIDASTVYRLSEWVKLNFSNGCTEKQLVDVMISQGRSEESIAQVFTEARKVTSEKMVQAVIQQNKMASSVFRVLTKLHYQNPKNLIIDKINITSKEDFYNDYWTANKPVVIKNFTTEWGLTERWSPNNLVKKYVNIMVEVQTNRTKNKTYELDMVKHKTKMLFGEYIKLINSVDESNDFYMMANNQVFNTTKLAELVDEIPNVPDYLNPPSRNGRWHFWIGPKGTITPLHHDQHCIIHAQVRGRKKWKLISPLHLPDLYNNPGTFSQVDIENIDYEAFPLMKNVNVLETIVEPGEAMFVPLGWWHNVVALDEVVSISTVDFVFENKWEFENPP